LVDSVELAGNGRKHQRTAFETTKWRQLRALVICLQVALETEPSVASEHQKSGGKS